MNFVETRVALAPHQHAGIEGDDAHQKGEHGAFNHSDDVISNGQGTVAEAFVGVENQIGQRVDERGRQNHDEGGALDQAGELGATESY